MKNEQLEETCIAEIHYKYIIKSISIKQVFTITGFNLPQNLAVCQVVAYSPDFIQEEISKFICQLTVLPPRWHWIGFSPGL